MRHGTSNSLFQVALYLSSWWAGSGAGVEPAASGEGFFFFFTLVTGPRRSLRLKLSDTRVYEPQIRARLGTTAHFCEVVVLKLRAIQLKHTPSWAGSGAGVEPAPPDEGRDHDRLLRRLHLLPHPGQDDQIVD